MRTHPSRLDDESLRYLQIVETTTGAAYDGVFIDRGATWFSGPRGGWLLLLILGIVALAGAGALCWPELLDRIEQPSRSTVQAILAGLGILLFATGVARFRRPPGPINRSFLFADALHLWDVTPGRVEATELTNLRQAGGTHHYTNRAYTHSSMTLTFTSGSRTLSISGLKIAERLLSFLQVLIAIRNSEDEELRRMALVDPGRLGSLAHHISGDGTARDWPGPTREVNLPRPQVVSAQPGSAPTWKRTLLRWLAGGAIAAAGYFAFPLVDRFCLDEYLFAAVPPAADPKGMTTGIQASNKYLAVFRSDGRHTAQVIERRDDWLFARASQEATQRDSPRSLRDYLADQENTRHRDEALKLIGGYYDRTIADLQKKRAEANKKNIDQNLFEGVLSLLQALKKAPSPVITVGFKGQIDEVPTTEFQKTFEKTVYDMRMKDKPELKDIARRQPDHSAILPRGAVFDPVQRARRENVILDRLRAVLAQAIKHDIMVLQPVEAGQKAALEVGYHIFAPGRLYLYTAGDGPGRERVKGLLRGYEINWTITFLPPGAEEPFPCKLGSQPALSLNYSSHPSDPDWAPYAIILYSAFHDMSSRLIRGFALDPGPAPNSFSFDAVATHKK
jgi:hypothetical protein